MQTQTKILDEIFIRSIDLTAIEVIKPLNKKLFGEDRIINDLGNEDTLILTAWHGNLLTGFKIGYGMENHVYYSAKSGVLPEFRRNGIATRLLYRMILEIKKRGYKKLVYDTFPNRFPGMMSLGMKENFRPVRVKWNPVFKDNQVRMELVICQRSKVESR